ncbi:MAG: methyl-accepting chemotaxis protein [Bacteroidota bacterium]|nr:methyl-accepting chemotaxis protein [Bacteroidota bacterium]
MKWINKLSIRNKLLLGFTVLLTFVLVLIYVSFSSLTTIRDTQRTLTTVEYPLSIELLKLRSALNRERLAITRIVLVQDDEVTKQWNDELVGLNTTVTSIIDTIQILGKDKPKIISGIQDFARQRNTFKAYKDTLLHVYNTPQTHVKAELLLTGTLFVINENMRENIVGLSDISEMDVELLKQKAETTYNNVVMSFAVFGVLLILLCLMLTVFFVRAIALPIQALAKQADRIAYGDLSVKIEVKDGSDEVAVMQRSFGMMVSSLRSVSEELKSTVDTLDNLSSEVNSELERGFNDTAAILRWIEKFSASVTAISKGLNALMNEFKL